jgi:hypothetical protein
MIKCSIHFDAVAYYFPYLRKISNRIDSSFIFLPCRPIVGDRIILEDFFEQELFPLAAEEACLYIISDINIHQDYLSLRISPLIEA